MVEPPSWIDSEIWEAFVEMRKAKGKRFPFTERAAKMIVSELDRLRGQGHNPDEVLKQSVMSGWSGVFPLKQLTPALQQAAIPVDAAAQTKAYLQARDAAIPAKPSEEIKARLLAAKQAIRRTE